MACIDAYHLLPNLGSGRVDVEPNQTNFDSGRSQDDTWLSEMSSQFDSSPLFSTQGTTGSSHTGGSHFGAPNEPQQAPQHLVTDHDPMSDVPGYGTGSLNTYRWQDEDSSHHRHAPETWAGLSSAAYETLDFWRNRCQNQQRPPSEREIELIASLENLSVETVRSWFTETLNISLQMPNFDQPQAADAMNAPTHVGSGSNNVLAEVAAYASERNIRACENSQSRKSARGNMQKTLPCCLGCTYSTGDKDSWHRHHKNKFPQEFWHCVLCRNVGRSFICHRKDKLTPHLNSIHPDHGTIREGRHDEVRDQSYVPYVAGCPTSCPFSKGGVPCGHTFSSYAEFAQHCLDHLQSRVLPSSDGPWTLRFKRQGPFDDEDDGQGPSRSTSFYSASAGFVGTTAAASSKHNAAGNSHRERKSKMTTQNNLSGAAEIAEGPTFLIDVHLNEVVPAPVKARFLALEYSWAARECTGARQMPNRDVLALAGQQLYADDLPSPFWRAMNLARDMGYRYLWIDYKCEGIKNACIRDIVYKRAVFIIVIVSMDSSSDHIWHFTCDHRNLDTVLSWLETSIPSLPFLHIQNLGHGAHGIVDEVQLRTSPESFARKVCIQRKDDGQPPDLHEIELLQRFKHPNIPRFIAAYYQKRALNILMLPVAECNLKEYLSEPTAYNKRPHMQEWYYSLASAVDYMHSLSCRHKDIKPANVLISGHTVYLSDFGTSLDFSLDSSVSSGPGFMTPKYCAPEVARRGSRGRKADIFSLGCVFLELITVDVGLPLNSLSQYLGFYKQPRKHSSVYHQHIDRLKNWITSLRSRASKAHQDLVLRITDRMLDAKPEERPSAAEVAGSLWAVLPPFDDRVRHDHLPSGSSMALYSRPGALTQGAQWAVSYEFYPPRVEPVTQLVFLWSYCNGGMTIRCVGIATSSLYSVEYDIRAWRAQSTQDAMSRGTTPSKHQPRNLGISASLVEELVTRESTVARGLRRLRKLVRTLFSVPWTSSRDKSPTLLVRQNCSKAFTGRRLPPSKRLSLEAKEDHCEIRPSLQYDSFSMRASSLPSLDRHISLCHFTAIDYLYSCESTIWKARVHRIFSNGSRYDDLLSSSLTPLPDVELVEKLPEPDSAWQEKQELHCCNSLTPLHKTVLPLAKTDEASTLLLNMPMACSDAFHGREEILARLARAPAATMVIHGVAGIGKTQLASEFTKRYQSLYDAVFWIPADSAADVADFEPVHTGRLLCMRDCDPLREKLIVQNNRRLVNHHQRSDELDRNCSMLADWEEPIDLSKMTLPEMIAGMALPNLTLPDLSNRRILTDFAAEMTLSDLSKWSIVSFE
ncbi:hypothetical protein DOTSEDRAFT_45500 [Dothistroma septosporum NZE10]|uniref:Protein kinase domain-containing protein n=1 Tax=Dothistroma septosporum (strain NZE10 / CBS 128990) TaxID=675120 RepID=M2YPU0_DOTSN|nr:hypothetical protein DOTSEDRAFT_45500 [Dothistroma septosporum NZE10]